MAFLGAVAETYDPAATVTQVVADFLGHLGCDPGDLRVAPGGQAVQKQQVISIKEKLPNHSSGKVTIRQFYQVQIAPIPGVAQVGEIIFSPPAAFRLAGGGQPQPSMTDQIQRNISQRHILF